LRCYIIVIVSKSNTLFTTAFSSAYCEVPCRLDPHSFGILRCVKSQKERRFNLSSRRKPEIKNVCHLSLLHPVLPGLYFLTFCTREFIVSLLRHLCPILMNLFPCDCYDTVSRSRLYCVGKYNPYMH
jgi:hypothetical protein